MIRAWCPVPRIGTVALLPLSFTSPHNFLRISWPNYPHLNAVKEPVISITAPTPTDFKPNVHGRIYRTTTFFADAALFDMVRRFTSHHAELSHTQKSMHALCAGRNADGSRRRGRGGVGPSGARNRRGSRVRGSRRRTASARSTIWRASEPHLHLHELSAAVDDLERSILFYLGCVRARVLGRSGRFYAVVPVRRRLRAQLDGQFVRVFAGAGRDAST